MGVIGGGEEGDRRRGDHLHAREGWERDGMRERGQPIRDESRDCKRERVNIGRNRRPSQGLGEREMRENPEPRAVPREGRHRLVGRRLVRRCLLGRRPFRRRPFRRRRPFLRLSRGRRRVPPVSKRTGERTLLALSNFAQHGASSHAITKREGLRRVVVKMARQPEAVAAAFGAAGAAKLSRNESGHPGRQCRRLPMCPSRRAGHAPTRHQSSPGKEAQLQGTLTRRMSAVASSRPHPMASRRRLFAVGQQSADGVCPRRRGRCVRFAFIGRSSSAYLGSLNRATTSHFFCLFALSRAVLLPQSRLVPSLGLVRSVGSAPRSRRRLAIAR